MMEKEEIKATLEALAEPEYQRFASSLIPNLAPGRLLGVRLPKLRRIAARIAKEGWKEWINQAGEDSFEEIMLQGMVIGYAKGEVGELQEYIRLFLPKIDNWSVCDSFCSGLKIAREYPEEMFIFITPYFEGKEEYQVRFALVMLLNYYVSAEYLKRAFACVERVRLDTYYVNTAAAWAVSIFYLSYPAETLEYLEHCGLDDFIYNKALQKITESRCLDQETKKQIRAMKRPASVSGTKKPV